MKRNKYIIGMIAAAMAVASCSDFSDYNEEYTSGPQEAQQSLWQNIEQNPQLSQFAQLVRSVGFNEKLNGSNTFTVWAPVNGTFDDIYQKYANADSISIVKEFVQSHVANYNYTVSGDVDAKVTALNNKTFEFVTDSGVVKYGLRQLLTMNQGAGNGVMHTIDGAVEYLPNIYAYMRWYSQGADSIKAYFNKYHSETLNKNKSTAGDYDDLGQLHYKDSVMDSTNTMFRSLRAYIEVEDSNYTMMMPTDEAYVNAYNRIKSYYKYPTKAAYRYFSSTIKEDRINEKAQSVQADYLSDSITRITIAGSLFFNNNRLYNRWVFNPSSEPSDTLMSTARNYFSNGADFIPGTSPCLVKQVRMSNGFVNILDSLPIKSWEGWAPPIYVSPTSRSARALADGTTAVSTRVLKNYFNSEKYTLPEGVENVSYLDCRVENDRSVPKIDFYLNNTLSTKYHVFVVTVPGDISIDTDSGFVKKAYKFAVKVGYGNESGSAMQEVELKNPATNNKDFFSDSLAIDTIYCGSITFPVAYANIPLTDNDLHVCPYLHIESTRSTVLRAQWAIYDNNLRLAGVLLIPEDYLEEWSRKWLPKFHDEKFPVTN